MKIRPLAGIALTLSLLTGCLEFNEVTQLKPDGTVDFTLSIQLPDFPDKKKEDEKQKEAERDIEEMFQKMAGSVQLKGKTEKTEYGKTTFTLAAAMDSLSGIGRIYQGIGKAESGKEKKEGKEVFDEIFSQKNDYRVKKGGSNSLIITRSFVPPKKAKKKAEKKERQGFSGILQGHGGHDAERDDLPVRVLLSHRGDPQQRDAGLRQQPPLGRLAGLSLGEALPDGDRDRRDAGVGGGLIEEVSSRFFTRFHRRPQADARGLSFECRAS